MAIDKTFLVSYLISLFWQSPKGKKIETRSKHYFELFYRHTTPTQQTPKSACTHEE